MRNGCAGSEPGLGGYWGSVAKDEEQFVRTDLEVVTGAGAEQQSETKAQGEGEGEGQGEADKLAVILKFQLGSSQYATMAFLSVIVTLLYEVSVRHKNTKDSSLAD